MSATPESIDHDVDATTDEGIFLEAQERLKIAEAAESENRIRGVDALSFIDGQQWDDSIANDRKLDGRPALTINHTNTYAQRLKNTLRQQRPRIKCHPVGGGAQIEDANVVNGLIRHIETLSNASVAYDGGVESAVDIGWGYWRVNSEYIDNKSFDQELKISPIPNTFTVYMDPSAIMPAGEDQTWCFITEVMKRREYKRKYPKAANAEWQNSAPGDMSLDWENKEQIRLAEYYRIHETPDTLYLMTDGRAWLKSELPDAETMLAAGFRIQMDATGKPISRPTTRRQVEWYRLNGKMIVDRRVIPGRFIPVIRCEGNVRNIDGEVRRKGMIQDMMDPARMFNYWRTAQTERYALAPKAPWVAAEGQIEGHPEWQDANRKSYSTLIYKPIAGPDGVTPLLPPQRQAPAQVEAGMTEAAAGAERDLMGVAGMPLDNPEITARVVSGNKHLQRRQGMQDLVHYQYYDKQTLAIMWTGIILLELIPHYYDTQRMQRIIGEDGIPQVVEINKSAPSEGVEAGTPQASNNIKHNLQVGRYDIVMDTGPGYATKREEGAENMLELLSTPLAEPIIKTGADIVVRNMDFAGADELADRMAVTTPDGLKKVVEGLPKQAQAIVGALQAQIQSLQQQNQQQALELKYRGTIEAAKLEQAHKKIDTEDKTKRLDIETKAHTSLAVAEIHGASQLLNTNTEAAHDRRAAQDMIDSAQRAVDQKV